MEGKIKGNESERSSSVDRCVRGWTSDPGRRKGLVRPELRPSLIRLDSSGRNEGL